MQQRRRKPPFTEGKVFAGGKEVSAKTLNEGHDAYMLYCFACHGPNGRRQGPRGLSATARRRATSRRASSSSRASARAKTSPTDEDLYRIVHGGLHGTAMLAVGRPRGVLDNIIQYVKTFAPQKWEKKKKNGDPVKTIEDFKPTDDPWDGKDAEAVQRARSSITSAPSA